MVIIYACRKVYVYEKCERDGVKMYPYKDVMNVMVRTQQEY